MIVKVLLNTFKFYLVRIMFYTLSYQCLDISWDVYATWANFLKFTKIEKLHVLKKVTENDQRY